MKRAQGWLVATCYGRFAGFVRFGISFEHGRLEIIGEIPSSLRYGTFFVFSKIVDFPSLRLIATIWSDMGVSQEDGNKELFEFSNAELAGGIFAGRRSRFLGRFLAFWVG
jgi:hypothetical protein